MKSKVIYILALLLICMGANLQTKAQFYGLEDNGNGSYTLWLPGGSITTNTQGQYSASQGIGTYCIGCYAVPIYGNTTPEYHSVQQPWRFLVGPPPAGYYSSVISQNYESFFDANGNWIGNVAFGTPPPQQGITGYSEGCNTCAQQQAQTVASQQWNTTNVNNFNSQSAVFQQNILATFQQNMWDAYNTGNTYNYYYYYYTINQLTNGNLGTTPLDPPPLTPPIPGPDVDRIIPTPNTVVKIDAVHNGNRTYVAPNGAPFILPSNAKVGGLLIDFDDFPNGALYSFYIGDDEYRADESFYRRNSAIGEPQFRGYFKVNPVTKKCDMQSPYVPTETPAINPNDNTTITVVRIRKVITPTDCYLVQELVSYTVYQGNPSSLPPNGNTWYNHSTEIEYSPTVPNSTPNSTVVKCPSSGTGSEASPMTVDQWAVNNPEGGISRLQSALNTHIKNSVKIYIVDCSTGTVKYTVTKDAYNTLTPAQQATETANYNNEFNSNNFSNTSQSLVFSGCIENGKWTYKAKINPNSISNPHPKAAPVINQILDELKRQADDEVSKLRNPNSRSKGETFEVGNGERFLKMDMNLFNAIAAIYDIGKDIINTGALPERVWDGGRRSTGTDQNLALEHSKSPFQIPSTIAGALDEIIEQITGIVQLVKTGLEIMRHPVQSAKTIWNNVKSLTIEKIKQMIENLTGLGNINAGGDRARYQSGRYAVMAATIFVSSIKNASTGLDLIKGSGDEITGAQKFIPDNLPNSDAGKALKNATDNNLPAKVIDEDKMIAYQKDVATNQNKFAAIDKSGDVYHGNGANNMDEVGLDVKQKAEAGDLAEGAESPTVFNEMKTQPQKFKDGKDFEKRVRDDPNTKTAVGNKAGIDLSGHTKLTQVQIKTSNGYMVADEVYIKKNAAGEYEVVINETKLSNASPFTERQNQFMTDMQNGTLDFELRNTKFDKPEFGDLEQGTMLKVKAFIKTEGDGTVQGPGVNYFKYNAQTGQWQ